MTPELAFMEAVQAILVADPAVTALVAGAVFDEVPADDAPGEPPLIWIGPINRRRVGDVGWTVRGRLYAQSVGFGRKEAWEIANAASEALEGAEPAVADPFAVVDMLRVIQAGDVFSEKGDFKTAFIDVETTIQRVM